MEATKNTMALILRRQPFREADSLVTVYTPDYGKLTLIARGTKKLQSKLAGHLEPFTLIDLMIISGKGRDYIGSAIGREAYQRLRADLNKLYYAGQAIRVFDQLVREGEADRELFILLKEWLGHLNGPRDFRSAQPLSKTAGGFQLAVFVNQLLEHLGYGPDLYNCRVCGKKIAAGLNHFDLLAGGLVDSECYKKISSEKEFPSNHYLPISDNVVKILRFIRDNSGEAIGKLKLSAILVKEFSRFTKNFLNFRL